MNNDDRLIYEAAPLPAAPAHSSGVQAMPTAGATGTPAAPAAPVVSAGGAEAQATAAADPSQYAEPVASIMNILTNWSTAMSSGQRYEVDSFNQDTGEAINPEVVKGMKDIIAQMVKLGTSTRGGAQGTPLQSNVPR